MIPLVIKTITNNDHPINRTNVLEPLVQIENSTDNKPQSNSDHKQTEEYSILLAFAYGIRKRAI